MTENRAQNKTEYHQILLSYALENEAKRNADKWTGSRKDRDGTSSKKPGGFALLAGDASVGSWFREIHVPRAWRVYLATGFDFREKKIALVLGRSEPE